MGRHREVSGIPANYIVTLFLIGIISARAQGLNRATVKGYFDLLNKILEENDLFNMPSNIYNMDETGFQLNNRPSEVLAAKGSKVVATVSSAEKGETITVVTCCNAEGTFLPPTCIMKGKNKKQELEDSMPPGATLYMNTKSAYINSEIFFKWLKEVFVPRKPKNKVLLILDGHSSHSTSIETLEYAESNGIIMVCYPGHTTHYLQPLDRAVFKSLKINFYESCRLWVKNHPGRRITRYQFGELLCQSWGKSTSSDNAIAGFRATGIYPFNPAAIPEYAFTGSIALKNVRVIIPPAVKSSDTVLLECEYDLEEEPLYTLKWYKGNKEFYRYIPKELPNKMVFPFSGIRVDLNRSSDNKLVLKEVLPEVTGRYKCEVSSDAPYFDTLMDSGYMFVVDIPVEDPSLEVGLGLLEVGATLKGNCSSPPSYPAANVTWFLNGEQVNDSFVKRSQRQLPLNDPKTTQAINSRRVPLITDSALELEIDGNTFNGGKAELLCKASIFNLYQKEKGITLEEERPKPRPSSVLSNREAKSGASKITVFYGLHVLLFIFSILTR